MPYGAAPIIVKWKRCVPSEASHEKTLPSGAPSHTTSSPPPNSSAPRPGIGAVTGALHAPPPSDDTPLASLPSGCDQRSVGDAATTALVTLLFWLSWWCRGQPATASESGLRTSRCVVTLQPW